jgi:hypothetical protein
LRWAGQVVECGGEDEVYRGSVAFTSAFTVPPLHLRIQCATSLPGTPEQVTRPRWLGAAKDALGLIAPLIGDKMDEFTPYMGRLAS